MRPCVRCRGTSFIDGNCERCGRPLVPDRDYFDWIEMLSKKVVHLAYDEFDDFSLAQPEAGSELQQAIVELGRRLHSYHYEGDGCLDH